MVFRVKVTPQAKQDANIILAWLLSQEAGEAGLRWFRRLKEAIASLSQLPGRCPLAPENASVPFEMWQLLYGRKPHVYRILFTSHPPRTPPAPRQALTAAFKTGQLSARPRAARHFPGRAARRRQPHGTGCTWLSSPISCPSDRASALAVSRLRQPIIGKTHFFVSPWCSPVTVVAFCATSCGAATVLFVPRMCFLRRAISARSLLAF
jgi:plasmid stabilization system protein ParE